MTASRNESTLTRPDDGQLNFVDTLSSLNYSNPFSTEQALTNSRYMAFQDGRLVPAEPTTNPITPLAEFVHDGFRALVLNPHFTCVAAKSAFNKNNYRYAMYENDIASPDATAGLAHDLFAFLREQDTLRQQGFSTFVASFCGPAVTHEEDFERLLWRQLQSLHDLDAPLHGWDTSVSDDPNDPHFEFSFAGRACFVVGIHPASSRWTRRFAWPTLVFNAHFQFEELRGAGKYGRMQDVMRSRDRQLQGSINANLADFGDHSDARQYSGRPVGDAWQCPFHAHARKAAAQAETDTEGAGAGEHDKRGRS